MPKPVPASEIKKRIAAKKKEVIAAKKSIVATQAEFLKDPGSREPAAEYRGAVAKHIETVREFGKLEEWYDKKAA